MPFRLRPDGKLRLTENDVEKQCLDLLRYRGFYPIRLQSGRFLALNRGEFLCEACRTKVRWVTVGEPGLPDYIVPTPGSFFLETKGSGGRLEESQKQKIGELNRLRRLPTVVTDSVEALDEWLDQQTKG